MSALGVLLVEDDPTTAELIGNALRPWRDELEAHSNPSDAMDSHRPIDVAIVALGIQKGAGLALVHFFRARDPDLAIIALTAAGDAEAEMVAHALGVTATIPKPLTGDALLVALAPVRERKAARSITAAFQRTVPLTSLLEATTPLALAHALADSAHFLTAAAARAVLDDMREGEVEAHAGNGSASEAIPLIAFDESVGTLYVTAGAPGLATESARAELQQLALTAATVGVLLRRVESVARTGIKDPETSAYTFAYFVDVAGREIERARRYERRFGLLTFVVDNYAELRATTSEDALREARRELVDTILDAVRDTDVLAHVEDDEMYLLVPDTGLLGALACRRRIAERQNRRSELARLEGRPSLSVTIGLATYPRDGRDLTSLLKSCHKRSIASQGSPAVAAMREMRGGLEAMLGVLLRFKPDETSWQVRQCALASETIAAMGTAVARESSRGSGVGDGVIYLVGDKSHPLVRGAHETLRLAPVGGTPSYWLRPRPLDGRNEISSQGVRMNPVEIEVDGMRIGPFVILAALTEGWAYACVASEHGDYKRVIHTCELELVEGLVAEMQTTFHLQRGLE